MKGWFITGTDTGVGKTFVTVGLLHYLNERGLQTAGMKPIASGCERTPDGLRNDDALRILEASVPELPYELVNPYSFEPPIAPHIAAAKAGAMIEMKTILDSFDAIRSRVDCIVVEGVGGWEVPLSEDTGMPDLAAVLGLPVILVVGIRLGCINHALLTADAVRARGLELAGWVANRVDTAVDEEQAVIEAIMNRIGSPMLGSIHHGQQVFSEAFTLQF
ncbi:MAG: dethiobiotin synthase [Gammaproteobacteria bacterium]|jgi:dethiobiotin synthetase